MIVTIHRIAALEVGEQDIANWAIDLAQTDTARIERRIERKLRGVNLHGFWNRCDLRELAAALLKIADEGGVQIAVSVERAK